MKIYLMFYQQISDLADTVVFPVNIKPGRKITESKRRNYSILQLHSLDCTWILQTRGCFLSFKIISKQKKNTILTSQHLSNNQQTVKLNVQLHGTNWLKATKSQSRQTSYLNRYSSTFHNIAAPKIAKKAYSRATCKEKIIEITTNSRNQHCVKGKIF